MHTWHTYIHTHTVLSPLHSKALTRWVAARIHTHAHTHTHTYTHTHTHTLLSPLHSKELTRVSTARTYMHTHTLYWVTYTARSSHWWVVHAYMHTHTQTRTLPSLLHSKAAHTVSSAHTHTHTHTTHTHLHSTGADPVLKMLSNLLRTGFIYIRARAKAIAEVASDTYCTVSQSVYLY